MGPQVTYDPFTDQEKADGGGGLLVHHQAPLLRRDDVFMMFKTGTCTPAAPGNLATRWNSQVWNERRLSLTPPLAISRSGVVLTSNNGRLFAVGSGHQAGR